MANYSNREYADMHFVYGFTNGNGSQAAEEYASRYPGRYATIFSASSKGFSGLPVILLDFHKMETSTICTKGLDYYGVLGINKCATGLDIKNAYRKLSMQYNPERHNDPSLHGLFALVGEAYEVLSSPLLKAIYDQYGEAGLKKGVVTPYGYNPPYVYHGDPFRTFKLTFHFQYIEYWETKGDIIFVVEDRPHPVFRREGVNLVMTTHITVEQSLTGTTLVINTLDDRILRVAITQVVTPEYVKVVNGEGMPYPNDRDKKGDLLIKFQVDYPKFLPQNSKKMIARAFAMANAAAKDYESRIETWTKIVRDDKLMRTVPPVNSMYSNQPNIVQVGPNLYMQPPPPKMASLADRNRAFMPVDASAPPPILPLGK